MKIYYRVPKFNKSSLFTTQAATLDPQTCAMDYFLKRGGGERRWPIELELSESHDGPWKRFDVSLVTYPKFNIAEAV